MFRCSGRRLPARFNCSDYSSLRYGCRPVGCRPLLCPVCRIDITKRPAANRYVYFVKTWQFFFVLKALKKSLHSIVTINVGEWCVKSKPTGPNNKEPTPRLAEFCTGDTIKGWDYKYKNESGFIRERITI